MLKVFLIKYYPFTFVNFYNFRENKKTFAAAKLGRSLPWQIYHGHPIMSAIYIFAVIRLSAKSPNSVTTIDVARPMLNSGETMKKEASFGRLACISYFYCQSKVLNAYVVEADTRRARNIWS